MKYFLGKIRSITLLHGNIFNKKMKNGDVFSVYSLFFITFYSIYGKLNLNEV